MAVYKYNKDTFFNATNGGLTYIQHVYPQSIGLEGKNKGFKIRDEKTPSTRLRQDDKGIWYVKDFGNDDKSMNAIALCMKEEGITDFKDALQFLYAFAGLESATVATFQPEWRQEPTDLDIGYYAITYCDEVVHTAVFAHYLTPETCKAYNFKSVAQYQFVSYKKDTNGTATTQKILNTVVATEHYPIFAFDATDFVKLYEPFAKKQYRFRFFGTKPERFIYGWDNVLDKVDIPQLRSLRADLKNTSDKKEQAYLEEKINDMLLPSVIVASGGSDGLNIAALGYNVIWYNNETEQLNYNEYQDLKEICKTVYNLPDIDATGKKQGVKLGLKFLELKTIWLPNNLLQKGGKDFRDWMHGYKHLGLEKTKRAFAKLLHLALAFRWWRWNSKTGAYRYNYVSLLYFLEHQGFYVYSLNHKNQQKGTSSSIFIKIDGNIVKEVTAPEIKTYLQDWLKENQIDLEVLNMVIGSQFLNEKSLLSLPTKRIDFSIATQHEQLFFFNNKMVRVTAEGITHPQAGSVSNKIWSSKVIPHDIKLNSTPQFTIAKDVNDNWDIVVHEQNNTIA